MDVRDGVDGARAALAALCAGAGQQSLTSRTIWCRTRSNARARPHRHVPGRHAILRAWLFTIMHNVFTAQIRRARRRRARSMWRSMTKTFMKAEFARAGAADPARWKCAISTTRCSVCRLTSAKWCCSSIGLEEMKLCRRRARAERAHRHGHVAAFARTQTASSALARARPRARARACVRALTVPRARARARALLPPFLRTYCLAS